MPSGKQVLLSLLNDCSQRLVEGGGVAEVTDRLRAGLLLHGSTADEMWFHAERMAWISESEEGEMVRQGIGLKEKNIFLSDLFEYIVSDETIPDGVKKKYPTLTQKEYNSASRIIWCLISSLGYFPQLASVEDNGNLDTVAAENLLLSYINKLKLFREDPDEIIGQIGFRG